MRKWLSAVALACLCAACGGSGSSTEPATPGADTTAEPDALREKKAPPEPVYKEVTLPAGTTLRLDLKSSVASDTSKVEDTVRAALRQAVVVDGHTVLPAGTELVGTVTDVARSGRVKGRARVAYRFSSLRHDSERYDINTAPIAHEAEATKKKDATKIAIGAGAGAALGAILGGGSGAAKGAAIGGGAGTGAVLATRGDEVRRGPGADVTTRLTAPLTVRVKA
ncbi:MAG TPA: hypothetical protein VKA59_12180 [Vicinamibacterales bacterium]|nr:hypothetical protein [Vicinamibacterales bacterium]